MKGMEQLFKMFGFDPDDIKQQINVAAAKFEEVRAHFDAQNKLIIAQNEKILSLLLEGGEK